ncbi:MAG TPA: glucokinase [Gemmatimonadaceae bacterium]|nr:glucokinase [Gemmatimonadaceae bacterium]
MLLAGDIGGTKTRLALYEETPNALRLVRHETYDSRSAATLGELVVQFLASSENPPVAAGCFGVAGPVVGGKARTTNLPWNVSERSMADELRIPRVRLLNDLEAAAYGVIAITDPASLLTLQAGEPPPEHRALTLVAAGTGLGVALMSWDGERYVVAPSEGGHCDFAPQDPLEDELLLWLRSDFGHVSYERVVSGPGLANICRFLRHYRNEPEPAWLTARIAGGDPAPVISEAALAHEDAICDEALTRFVSIYGAAAGNFALTALAVGGVFLGGGIAPKILPRILDGPFLTSFAAKGRFAPALGKVPVRVVLAPDVALLGAAACIASAPPSL